MWNIAHYFINELCLHTIIFVESPQYN